MGKTSRIIKKNVAINSVRRNKTFTQDPSPRHPHVLLKNETIPPSNREFAQSPPQGTTLWHPRVVPLPGCVGKAWTWARILGCENGRGRRARAGPARPPGRLCQAQAGGKRGRRGGQALWGLPGCQAAAGLNLLPVDHGLTIDASGLSALSGGPNTEVSRMSSSRTGQLNCKEQVHCAFRVGCK